MRIILFYLCGNEHEGINFIIEKSNKYYSQTL